MTDEAEAAPVLVLCRDLLFASKITGAARAQGVPIKLVRDGSQLTAEGGRKLIVDLNQSGAIDAAVAWKRQTAGEVVGFVSHVDAETIVQARAAGINHVLARSQFVAQLSNFIASL